MRTKVIYAFTLMIFFIVFIFTGCKSESKQIPDKDTTQVDVIVGYSVLFAKELPENSDVAQITNEDKRYMCKYITDKYQWLECHVVVDSDTVIAISNVFMVETDSVPDILLARHCLDDPSFPYMEGEFWFNDVDLNTAFYLPFDSIYSIYRQTHTPNDLVYAVLRKLCGPEEANAQWTFGSEENTFYVDAITGDTTSVDPFWPNYSE